MIEITSPGLLPPSIDYGAMDTSLNNIPLVICIFPSIDYGAMDTRQSDAKNKVIAPVFKLLGIIDQWGNGLKLIADELKEYPDIEFRWREVGLSFQVQFVKLNYFVEQQLHQESGQELGQELGQE